ncbi:hypothetical protein [Thermococcus sp.]|nr:hypothetical protein [Thermococcus sp.]
MILLRPLRKEPGETPVEKYEEALKETRNVEWKRLSTTPTS